jgi:hypothetical protein
LDGTAGVVRAGEQKKTYVDCLHRILLSVGGVQPRGKRLVKVFLDQHSLGIGSIRTPWSVMEHEARNCRIGRHVHHADGVNVLRSTQSGVASA